MKRKFQILVCAIGLSLIQSFGGAVAANERHLIGVLAFRGAAHALRSWQPTARALSDAIDGAEFKVVPLPLAELRRSVAEKKIAFVFTNSGQYVELEAEYGISRIATLKTFFGTDVRNVFGAVIFARADRDDIRSLEDLRGKSLAAVKRGAFGGFQMAWREFKSAGIDPFDDFSRIDFLGLPQDDIVIAVRDGRIDAGTVRTDVLETMADEQAIDLADYRILNAQGSAGQTVGLSTRLYPEWPFAAMPGTPSELSQKVAIALLSLSADSPAVAATGYAGWTVPLDYKPVHDMFRDLEIGPYTPGEIRFSAFLSQHWEWGLFALVLLGLVGLHGFRTEYLVRRRTGELSRAYDELEYETTERRRAEDRARKHEDELAHVSRISVIDEMTSSLAHELRQPLAAINNYAAGCIRRLGRDNSNPADIGQALDMISQQADRAGQIISRVRGYMQKREPRRDPVNLNHAIREASAMIGQELADQQVRLELELTEKMPKVMADIIELEQLIINLSKNAIDAMADTAPDKRRLTIKSWLDTNRIFVEVADTGPGFDEEDFDTLWEPFYSHKAGGLGLGLAICRTIVETHGGRIKVEGASSSGSVVVFELPALSESVDETG